MLYAYIFGSGLKTMWLGSTVETPDNCYSFLTFSFSLDKLQSDCGWS